MSGSWILDLESTGGLYREFLKRLTKDGACRFRRRELIRSYRGRLKFPELFEHHIGNRERFNVTCGLEITEKPVVKCKDVALWFRSLTGRSDVVVYPTDYKFYCPRHKGKRYRMSNGSDYFQSVKNYPISGSKLTKNFELESAGYVIDVDIHILVRLQNSTGSVVPRGWKYEYDLKLAEIVMKKSEVVGDYSVNKIVVKLEELSFDSVSNDNMVNNKEVCKKERIIRRALNTISSYQSKLIDIENLSVRVLVETTEGESSFLTPAGHAYNWNRMVSQNVDRLYNISKLAKEVKEFDLDLAKRVMEVVREDMSNIVSWMHFAEGYFNK
ncbi:putative pentatricopeptide repeat-containing protein [Tanacetum coccineum]